MDLKESQKGRGMKLLIKVVIVSIIVIVLVLYLGLTIYGKGLVTNIASGVLHTDVEIARVKFVPLRVALQLYEINIPKWKMIFPKGIIHLVPLRLQLHGLETMKELEISEDKLSLRVQAKNLLFKQRIWKFALDFKNVDLLDLSSKWPEAWSWGFTSGTLDGKIDGVFSDEKGCRLYGLLHFYNMAYDESGSVESKGPLGIPIEEIVEFIDAHRGSIDIDFTYKGPLNELNNPSRYRPGPKIIRSLGAYLIKKIT